jgi:uncharacterized membrane protein YgcG
MWLAPKLKLAGSLLVVVLILGSIWGAGQAAADSLPGNPLYNLKLAAETMRLRLTTNDQARANLALSYANQRLDEIAALAQSGKAIDGAMIDRAREQVSWAFQAADQLQEKQDLVALDQLMIAMQARWQAMVQVANQLPDSEQAQVQELLREMDRARQELQAGQGEPEGGQVRERVGTPAVPCDGSGSQPGPQATRTPARPGPTEQPGLRPSPQSTQGSTGPKPSEQPGMGPGPQVTQTPQSGLTKQPGSGPGPQATVTPQPAIPGQPSGPQATDRPGSGPGSQATAQPHEPSPTGNTGSGSDGTPNTGGNGGPPDSGGGGDGGGNDGGSGGGQGKP